MEDEKCIVFKKPVEAGGKTYDAIDLHEPSGREISKFFKVSEKEERGKAAWLWWRWSPASISKSSGAHHRATFRRP